MGADSIGDDPAKDAFSVAMSGMAREQPGECQDDYASCIGPGCDPSAPAPELKPAVDEKAKGGPSLAPDDQTQSGPEE